LELVETIMDVMDCAGRSIFAAAAAVRDNASGAESAVEPIGFKAEVPLKEGIRRSSSGGQACVRE